MMKSLETVLDMVCDAFGCRDYLQGYVCILFTLIISFSVYQITSSILEDRRLALKALRYVDYDRYVMIKRRHRRRVVFVQKLILAVFAWPVVLPWFVVKHLQQA